MILGMDWLSKHSPMHIHWAQKWLQFDHASKPIQLYGIQCATIMGPPISYDQLLAMQKQDSILFMIQLNAVEDSTSEDSDTSNVIPPAIQDIINQFSSIFQPLLELPPSRSKDHTIPLIPKAQPFRLRLYRYNPF